MAYLKLFFISFPMLSQVCAEDLPRDLAIQSHYDGAWVYGQRHGSIPLTSARCLLGLSLLLTGEHCMAM